MLEKIRDLQIKAYIAMTCFVQDLKSDERGMSGVVEAVLLILIAVLAVVFLWGKLGPWISGMWKKIQGSGDTINTIS